MSWIGLFLLVWLLLAAHAIVDWRVSWDARKKDLKAAYTVALIFTLACWLIAQGRW